MQKCNIIDRNKNIYMLQNRVSDAIYLVLFKQRISRIYLRILLVLAVSCNLIMEFKFNIIIENFKVYCM